jgi:hypothetical protein
MTDDDEENGVNVLIDFEQQITMVRIIEDMFLPSQLTIKAEVFPAEKSGDNDYEIAFAKVRFWLENIVTRCIAFSKTNDVAIGMLISTDGRNNTGNLLMLTPDEPSDENLAVILQAKMTALAGGKLMFGAVEIKSNNLTGLRFTFIGNNEELLPSMDEWVGEHTYFEKPWWNRDDASTLDVLPPSDANLDEKPAWAYDLDFIAKAFKQKAADVVLRPDFKPTIIEGGVREDE